MASLILTPRVKVPLDQTRSQQQPLPLVFGRTVTVSSSALIPRLPANSAVSPVVLCSSTLLCSDTRVCAE